MPATEEKPPVVFLALANARDSSERHLRDLPLEVVALRNLMEAAERDGLCELVVRTECTVDDLFGVFRDDRYRNRIAVVHFGGHANGHSVLLQSPAGNTVPAYAGGIAALLALQHSLQLVFLNACSTVKQVEQLLLTAKVPLVIATSRSVKDEVARLFAQEFYQFLASGAGVRQAFDAAEARVITAKGPQPTATYTSSASSEEMDHWPWILHPKEPLDGADQWSLPAAARDPLFGLPRLPRQDLPTTPYRNLSWFESKHAEIFFGRGLEIRELCDHLTALDSAPILLLYGQTGVGKSSLIHAGLLPRLQAVKDEAGDPKLEVRYLRRGENGLLATLHQALAPACDSASPGDTWKQAETACRRPLIIFLDQVDEAFPLVRVNAQDELTILTSFLRATFADPAHRPAGKIVLGFRKEFLAEITDSLDVVSLPRKPKLLSALDRQGVIEVIRGPEVTPRLRKHFGLVIEPDLPEQIANDLLADAKSAIAPTLQILLTKMWSAVTTQGQTQPHFTRQLYVGMKGKGRLLDKFLDEQMAAIKSRYPSQVQSGLLLDLLTTHTTEHATAAQCTREKLAKNYAHVAGDLENLLRECKGTYLLADPPAEDPPIQTRPTESTRLTHDILAPLVRALFDKSDLPGQRARRILDARSPEWAENKTGSPLDERDLSTVENARNGTRGWNDEEKRLIEASREAREERRKWRKRWRAIGIVAAAAILVAAVTAFVQWRRFVAASKRIVAANQQIVAANEKIVAANGKNQDLLGESLLRPIAASEKEEVESLWQLAQLPQESQRTRIAFVKDGLGDFDKIRQLSKRRAEALNAATGLNAETRERIYREGVLPYMKKLHPNPNSQIAATSAGCELGIRDQEFIELGSKILRESICDSSTSPREIPQLVSQLLSLTPKLEPAHQEEIEEALTLATEKIATVIVVTEEQIRDSSELERALGEDAAALCEGWASLPGHMNDARLTRVLEAFDEDRKRDDFKHPLLPCPRQIRACASLLPRAGQAGFDRLMSRIARCIGRGDSLSRTAERGPWLSGAEAITVLPPPLRSQAIRYLSRHWKDHTKESQDAMYRLTDTLVALSDHVDASNAQEYSDALSFGTVFSIRDYGDAFTTVKRNAPEASLVKPITSMLRSAETVRSSSYRTSALTSWLNQIERLASAAGSLQAKEAANVYLDDGVSFESGEDALSAWQALAVLVWIAHDSRLTDRAQAGFRSVPHASNWRYRNSATLLEGTKLRSSGSTEDITTLLDFLLKKLHEATDLTECAIYAGALQDLTTEQPRLRSTLQGALSEERAKQFPGLRNLGAEDQWLEQPYLTLESEGGWEATLARGVVPGSKFPRRKPSFDDAVALQRLARDSSPKEALERMHSLARAASGQRLPFFMADRLRAVWTALADAVPPDKASEALEMFSAYPDLFQGGVTVGGPLKECVSRLAAKVDGAGAQLAPEVIQSMRQETDRLRFDAFTVILCALPSVSAQYLVEVLKYPLAVGQSRAVILQRLGVIYNQSFPTVWDFVASVSKDPKLKPLLESPPDRSHFLGDPSRSPFGSFYQQK